MLVIVSAANKAYICFERNMDMLHVAQREICRWLWITQRGGRGAATDCLIDRKIV